MTGKNSPGNNVNHLTQESLYVDSNADATYLNPMKQQYTQGLLLGSPRLSRGEASFKRKKADRETQPTAITVTGNAA